MSTIGEFIVGLWFLPVLVFTVIPLTMFAIWLLIQAGKQAKGSTVKIKTDILDDANGDILATK